MFRKGFNDKNHNIPKKEKNSDWNIIRQNNIGQHLSLSFQSCTLEQKMPRISFNLNLITGKT